LERQAHAAALERPILRGGLFECEETDNLAASWRRQSGQRGGAGDELALERARVNQFIGAMNQFYKYDKGGVGAYNLAHPRPAVGAQRCLTSDEHCEASSVVRELL
jgi:hypothetical protein